MTEETLLELRNVTAAYDGRTVFENLSLSVGRGEFVLLHGNTGCGKSTVLRLLAGLERPTTGEIIVAGDRVDRFNEVQRRWLRRSMGLMVQEGLLLDDRSIHDNVMLPALAAEESFGEARSRALLALEKCGIAELATQLPRHLSAGQRQLVNLARAVVNRPVVILADEPVAHLDKSNARTLLDLLGAFVEAGASAVVNIHTHCPQGMEVYQGAPIVYSTGNFFFPMREQQPFDPDNLWYTGYVPRFTFDRNGAVAVEILPCRFLESPWRVEPLDEKAVRRFGEYFDTLSDLIAETRSCFEAWCTIVGGWNFESIRRATEGAPFADPGAIEVRKQILPLRNLFTCEAHKEMMDTYLRLIETGRLSAAAEKVALLKQLQHPGLYTE